MRSSNQLGTPKIVTCPGEPEKARQAATTFTAMPPTMNASNALTVSFVLAAELVNTAIEHLADHLHPELHPKIKLVKDCAAAAVLVVVLGGTLTAVTLGRGPSRASQMAADTGLKWEVYSTDKLHELKMGAFWSVSQGSEEPPALVVLRSQ